MIGISKIVYKIKMYRRVNVYNSIYWLIKLCKNNNLPKE